MVYTIIIIKQPVLGISDAVLAKPRRDLVEEHLAVS